MVLCKTTLCLLIRGYQILLSPLLHSFGGGCRFPVSCSTYSLQCFQTQPLMQAFLNTLKRLGSCHPF